MTRSWELNSKAGEWMARRLSSPPKPNKAQQKIAKLVVQDFLN